MTTRFWLLAILLNLSIATVACADEVGETTHTPNQEKRVVQVNQDLPHDIVDQVRDSHDVAKLRERLRESLGAYQQAAKKFGAGTPESRQAAHQVLESQTALHKQFVKEEALPAVPEIAQK